jgi:RNA polymerase sigma factor (sigma-70 family)
MEATYEELRPRAFAIAYRMLGSVGEAEDVVQEALLRLHRAERDGERIESPRAYLSTVVTRLAIDQLRSARARREAYVGEWLPEPLLADPEADPARQAEMADSLSLAFLVLLESLSPEQRAVFLLREVFDYPYDRIAEIVGKSETNVRQLALRARRHVDERRVCFDADVELHGDGGGKVPALARALFGRSRVARTLRNWARAARRMGGVEMRRVDVNGQPGAMMLDREGRVFSVMALDIAEGQIQGIRSIVNPDKLHHLGEVADMGALMRRE